MKSRTTSFQYVVFTSVLVALTLSIWLTISRKDTPYNSGWDVQSVLSSDPSPTELLDHFDLVTDGIFEGSRYFVIRTWGIELVGLQQIARVLGGHLVAIGSEEENSFVFDLTLEDEGHWQFVDGNAVGPMIGLLQASSGKEPDQGWAWANGEPVTYTNWKPHSPDNYGGNQDFANFLGRRTTSPDSRWNDMNGPNHSFIVEVPLKSPN